MEWGKERRVQMGVWYRRSAEGAMRESVECDKERVQRGVGERRKSTEKNVVKRKQCRRVRKGEGD